MIFATIILGLIVLIAVYSFFHTFGRPKNFPPGPFPLPVIGNLHLLGNKPHKACKDLSRKYGDVFSLFFGGHKVVVINSIETATEALIKKGADFAGRPPSTTGIEMARGHSTGRGINILYADYGIYWRTIRKIAHQALKMYGANKENLEAVIKTHSTELVDRLEGKNGIAFDPMKDLSLASTNIICTVVFGSKYDIEDEDFANILKFIRMMVEGMVGTSRADYLPLLSLLPDNSMKRLKEAVRMRDPIVEKWLAVHRESYNEDNIRDLTDALIYAANEEALEETSHRRYLGEDNIIMIMTDVFSAAVETTSVTLRWFILYSVIWPEKQRKIHEELDRVVGKDRIPQMTDRASLPYLEATINETARLASVAPLGIPHQTTCNTSVGGYDVPKGTHVFFNLYAIHYDERHWDDAEAFIPERWLDEDGKYFPGRHQSFLPFSAGRRVCFGEALAKMELFLILSHVFQRFEFKKAGGEQLPGLDGAVHVTHHPHPYKIVAVARK